MRSAETSRRELEHAARRSGNRVEYRELDGINGFAPSAKVVCPDGWGAARLLAELCDSDRGRPNLREAAEVLKKGASTAEEYARRVQAFVKNTIRFAPEKGEIFQSAQHTARTSVGDCDDHVRVVVGLLRAGGVPARLALLHPQGGGPRHVVAQAKLPRGWVYLETTCDAHFGEDPITAAGRLGIVRPDILAKKKLGVKFMGESPMKEPSSDSEEQAGEGGTLGAVTMGAVTAATSDLPDDFFAAGIALEERHGWNFEHMLAAMMNESGIHSHIANHANPTTGAVGLIQFMPQTAAGLLGMSDPLAARARMIAMGPTEQLQYVERFFAPHPGLTSAARFYQALFLPATLDKVTDPDAPLTGQNGPLAFAYAPNIGFDTARKGFITINDLQAAIDRTTRNSARFNEAVARTRDARGGFAPSTIASFSKSKLGNVLVWGLLITGAAGLLNAYAPSTYRAAKNVVLHPVRAARSFI